MFNIPIRLIFTLVILFHITPLLSAEIRISAEQLNKIPGKPELRIIDARTPALYQKGHISNAINFPADLTYEDLNVNGKLTNPETMQESIREAGLSKDSVVIIYDSGNLIDAARLFWALEVYGLSNVRVLNQGFDYWIQQKYPQSQKPATINKSNYVVSINHERLASKFTTQLASHNPNQVIIDARPEPAYQGKVSKAKRLGHIPTALNFPASHNLKFDSTITSLKPLDKLLDTYQSIPRNSKVIVYCAIGKISAINYLALRELDYNVANYDASWIEWGNDFSLPVEK